MGWLREPQRNPPNELDAALPDLARRAAVVSHAKAVSLPAGTVLFQPGDLCRQFLILLSGCLRVYRIARSGRDMLLYRVSGGGTCIMTTACLLSSESYAAGAVVAGGAMAWPLISSLNPAGDVLALAQVEVDLAPIRPGRGASSCGVAGPRSFATVPRPRSG